MRRRTRRERERENYGDDAREKHQRRGLREQNASEQRAYK
jgi:hypothetical protein